MEKKLSGEIYLPKPSSFCGSEAPSSFSNEQDFDDLPQFSQLLG